jgi:hypothetical protein
MLARSAGTGMMRQEQVEDDSGQSERGRFVDERRNQPDQGHL